MKLSSHQHPKNLPALCLRAQDSAPYLGVPELFWKLGLEPSMLNCILILRETIPQTVPKTCLTLAQPPPLCLSQWPFAVPFANLHLISGSSRTRQNWTQIESKILSEKVEGGKKVFSAISFQPPIFSSNHKSGTSVLVMTLLQERQGNGQAASCLISQ